MWKLILILILIAITNPNMLVFAEDNLHIDSTKLVVDRNKNTAVFTGNVLICFHGMKLTTEKVIFTFDDEKTTKIKVITFPEKIKALREIDNSSSVIIADTALYRVGSMELLLKGNVIIEDKEEVMITDQMLYYGKLKNIELDGK